MAVAIQLQVNGGGYGLAGDPVDAPAAAVIDARIDNASGAQNISWNIIGTYDPAVAKPALTFSGNPVGEIATFTLNANVGQSYGIQVTVRRDTGAVETATNAVYVLYGNGERPVFVGETTESNETHGRTEDFNRLIQSNLIPIVVSGLPPVNVDRSPASAGASSEVSPYDHKHDIDVAAPAQGIGGGNLVGSATTLALSDHDHTLRETSGPTDLTIGAIADGEALLRSGTAIVGSPFPTLSNIAPADVTKAAPNAGVSTEVSRVDHKHDIRTAAPAQGIGPLGNVEGVSSLLARSDHEHALRTTAGGGTDLTIGSIADGDVVIRSGTALIGEARVFGTEYDYDERLTTLSTGAGPTPYFTLTTANIPAGNYRVAWSCIGQKNSASTDWGVRVQVDNVTNVINATGDGFFHEEGIDAGADQRYARAGFRSNIALAAGVHTIDMDLQSFGGGTATLYEGFLEIYRVS